MQRFLALEQVSVVLSKLPALLPADMPYNDRQNPSYAVQRYLSAIGAHGLRPVLDETILPKPCSAYLFAIGAHGLRPPVGALSRIRDIALRYPLSRAAPYKIKKQRSHHFVQAQMGGITVF